MTNQKMIAGYIVTTLIAGSLGVYGGMTYQKTKSISAFGQRGTSQRLTQTRNNNQNTKNQIPSGTSAGMMNRGGAINGEITAKDDKSMTVKMPDGSSKIIILSSDTTYRIADEAKPEDLVVGKTVAVQGSTSPDGSTIATSVELNPLMRFQTPVSK